MATFDSVVAEVLNVVGWLSTTTEVATVEGIASLAGEGSHFILADGS